MVVEGDPAGATGDPTGGVPTASSWDAYLELVGAAAAEDEQELELCRILGDEPAAEAADDATSSQRYQVQTHLAKLPHHHRAAVAPPQRGGRLAPPLPLAAPPRNLRRTSPPRLRKPRTRPRPTRRTAPSARRARRRGPPPPPP